MIKIHGCILFTFLYTVAKALSAWVSGDFWSHMCVRKGYSWYVWGLPLSIVWVGMREGGINLSQAPPVTVGRGEGAKALLIPSLIVWPARPLPIFIFVVVYNFILYYILLPNITNLSIHCEKIVFSINSCPDIPMFRFCLCFFFVCVHIFFFLSHSLT